MKRGAWRRETGGHRAAHHPRVQRIPEQQPAAAERVLMRQRPGQHQPTLRRLAHIMHHLRDVFQEGVASGGEHAREELSGQTGADGTRQTGLPPAEP